MAQLSIEDATKLLSSGKTKPRQITADEALAILKPQKDLGVQQPIKVSATRQPFDWKAAQQKSMQDQAKAAGP
ncbi:hypothetical protein, partial [Acinetobacter baumannii]